MTPHKSYRLHTGPGFTESRPAHDAEDAIHMGALLPLPLAFRATYLTLRCTGIVLTRLGSELRHRDSLICFVEGLLTVMVTMHRNLQEDHL